MQIAVSLEIHEQMELLTHGAILHDLGKTSIAKSVLYKQGTLTKEEKEIIKLHTVIGAQILEKEGFPKELQEIVLYHHEYWDGNGYLGLTGENIPFLAQIISLADAMDAMISNRTYRAVLSPLEVFSEIQNCCGSQFSPGLVQNLKQSQFWPIGDSCSEKVSSVMVWESQWLKCLADVFDDLHHPLLLIQIQK
ncbi:MAG: HD-GYP domain-containing protein [Bacillota bacterium]